MSVSDKVAQQRIGRPLRLTRLLDKDLVARFAPQGCSVEIWSPALAREVARQRLGRPLRLARLLDSDFLGFVWISRT
jgi:hypothetical protein